MDTLRTVRVTGQERLHGGQALQKLSQKANSIPAQKSPGHDNSTLLPNRTPVPAPQIPALYQGTNYSLTPGAPILLAYMMIVMMLRDPPYEKRTSPMSQKMMSLFLLNRQAKDPPAPSLQDAQMESKGQIQIHSKVRGKLQIYSGIIVTPGIPSLLVRQSTTMKSSICHARRRKLQKRCVLQN